MKRIIRILGVGLILAFILLGLTSHEAKATFIDDPEPGGAFFFIDGANKDVASFTGQVGGQSTGVIVNVEAFGNVDTGNGYANIKPANKDVILTKLIFTPVDPNLFSDFSFRAQLLAVGDVIITVQDPNSIFSQTIKFENRSDQDFSRIGVYSLDGETIESVTISSNGFKEVKQINFSGEGVVNVIPEPATMLLLGSGLLGLAGYGRKKFFKK
jgi:hypothetical protein